MHFPRLRTNLTIWPPPQTSSLDDFILLFFCYYCRATNNEQDLKHTISTKRSEDLSPTHQMTAMADKAAQVVITEQRAHQEAEEMIL